MFRRTFGLGLISVHRKVLYGCCALMIMVFHMRTVFPSIFGTLQDLGEVGVEVFVLLTGFGLFRSMEKTPRAGVFYKKRFLRVFPPAFLVAALHYGLSGCGLGEYLCKITFFPFWLGVPTLWFVPFILTMYLFYPPIYFLQKKYGSAPLWGLTALTAAAALAAEIVGGRWADTTLCALCRTPVFLIGCIAAPAVIREASVGAWRIPASLAIGAAFVLIAPKLSFAYFFFRTIGYTFLAAFLIFVLAMIAECFTRGAVRRLIYRHFAFLGGISLEAYLLFSRLRFLLMELPAVRNGSAGMLKIEILTLLLTPVVSQLLKVLCQYMLKRIAPQAIAS